mmetsp:Transcript_129805/g.225595  ORF Transcript_129805/g.225595 Transcript_129805/m.225595 type:complete len:222 (+) Transcript_129805:371-1036(+)
MSSSASSGSPTTAQTRMAKRPLSDNCSLLRRAGDGDAGAASASGRAAGGEASDEAGGDEDAAACSEAALSSAALASAACASAMASSSASNQVFLFGSSSPSLLSILCSAANIRDIKSSPSAGCFAASGGLFSGSAFFSGWDLSRSPKRFGRSSARFVSVARSSRGSGLSAVASAAFFLESPSEACSSAAAALPETSRRFAGLKRRVLPPKRSTSTRPDAAS